MITPEFVQTMAAYNEEMNRRIYEAAARLSDQERMKQRGAFWGTIHGTLNHLLWGDAMWMSRFDGWERPAAGMKESAALFAAFDEMAHARKDADRRISEWAGRVSPAWLEQDLTWNSGVTGRAMRKPGWFLVTHFFNHQTHHRGQAHAMLTAAGETVGDTDLPFVIPSL